MARHVGIELTWARLSLLFFPHRSLGGRKREGARGRAALWKESYPRTQRGKTETLAMRAVNPAERSISVGFSKAWHTLSTTSYWDLHVLQWRRGICNNAVKFALLVRLRSTPDGCRGWPICKLAAARGSIRLLRHFNGRSWHQQRVSKEGSLSLTRRNEWMNDAFI